MFAAQDGATPNDKLYVDDVFSAYTYTGNGSTQTINNGIDLAGKGGIVWAKSRTSGTGNDHIIWNADGTSTRKYLITNDTGGASTASNGYGVTSFNSNGFTLGSTWGGENENGRSNVSWTFRKAAKFFDVVTYTGNGVNGRNVSHSLGMAPGMVILKRTDNNGDWFVWHRSGTQTNSYAAKLNLTDTYSNYGWNIWGAGGGTPSMTLSTFSVGDDLNVTSCTYVAYLFAHDTSADGLVQCGSFYHNNNTEINLGWEPQFLLVKRSDGVGAWYMLDTTREWVWAGDYTTTKAAILKANTSDAESSATFPTGAPWLSLTQTGFKIPGSGGAGGSYIYLAIRRPNKPPTSGTQVYNAIARTGTGAAATVTGVGFAPDSVLLHSRSGTTGGRWEDRLRGATQELVAETNALEAAVAESIKAFDMDGFSLGTDGDWNTNTATYINWCFKRAPGVFDIVCYPGTGSATTVSHGLGVAPELMIVKSRSDTQKIWLVYHKDVGHTKYLALEQTGGPWTDSTIWNNTAPSTSVFTLGTYSSSSNVTYVAYLFATKPGISKVFAFTGNGTNQNIDCGFTTGARFVLLKRTDAAGGWLVADTTRGIVSGNDPSLALNSTAAEVTTLDWIDPYSGGFNIVQESTNNANVNNASYIGLAFS